MKINTRTKTVDEIVNYEAFDGTTFKTEADCLKYEESAVGCAKQAAWHYLVAERCNYELFDTEDKGLWVFDVPDTHAYEVILHWATLHEVYRVSEFTPSYIGKRVAFMWCDWDVPSFIPCYATKEQMLEFYTKEIEKMFADKEDK